MKERIEKLRRSGAGPFVGLMTVLLTSVVFVAFLVGITVLVHFIME